MSDCWILLKARSPGPGRWRFFSRLSSFFVLLSSGLYARDLKEVQQEFLNGKYEGVIAAAKAEVRSASSDSADWYLLLIRTLLTVGRYGDADTALVAALQRDPSNIRLRWLARDVAFANGRPEEANRRADEIRQLAFSRMGMSRAPADLVVFGRAALLIGADPKDVLDKVYAAAQKADSSLRDVYLARGDLALEKHDFALAAKAYGDQVKLFPDDPDFHYGLARAYENGDRTTVGKELAEALKINPSHIPSLLMLADQQIGAEDYDAASKLLDDVAAVNPSHPEVGAYRAVIAHLRNHPEEEQSARDEALKFWKTNPKVDFLIGKKLGEKYRFAEAADYERKALDFDPTYLPAKAELASDLLRLGDETEGWSLAQQVHAKDGYDVEAFNLVTLEDTMAKYATLNNGDFEVRMTHHEAEIYGPQVLELLGRARRVLTEKYGVALPRPVYVEIFADQKDFAVRTFGVPDVAGFLGVCFGRVVTANSPAATAGANWQSVLWHEFCHVITLQLTQNKMPRWLSEGISVYEERQADPAWGMHLNPRYQEMIMGKDLTPVGKLSGAFLTPRSQTHLQFAYFESSMVVQFLVEKYGIDALKGVLADLRKGTEINEAIAAHSAPMPQFERDFTTFAREQVKQLAPQLDWTKPSPKLLAEGEEESLTEWQDKNADNYWALAGRGRRLLNDKKWSEAKALMTHFVQLYPGQTGGDSGWRMLAEANRGLGEKEEERKALANLAEMDADATDAYLRLVELGEESKDWTSVAKNSRRFLAVNPLVAPPYEALGRASAEQKDFPAAIGAYRTLLMLDPSDPVDAHFQLAQWLHRTGDAEAKRQVLQALEDAPRYRAALDLLMEINRTAPGGPATATAPLPASTQGKF